MRQRLCSGVLTLSFLSASFLSAAILFGASACRGQAVDCWLLDGDALARAHERGLCGDAFARNTVGGAPAVGEPIVVPKPRDEARRGRDVAAAPSPRPAVPPKPKREAASRAAPQAAAPALRDAAPSWNAPREEPSWNAPRPPEPSERRIESGPMEVAGVPPARPAAAPAPVQDPAPSPPTDPVAAFMNDLERDFRSLMAKLVSGR